MCIVFEKIGDIAANTSIPRLQGSMNVLEAMEIMDAEQTDIIAVECEDKFVGLFTRSNFTQSVIRQNLSPQETTLYEVMTLDVPSVESDATLKETYEAMLACRLDYIPVLDGTSLCGVVAMCDLGKNVMKSYEDAKSETELIKCYIQNGESYAMARYEA